MTSKLRIITHILALIVFKSTLAQALPSEIQADILNAEIKESMAQEKWDAAAKSMEKLQNLGVTLPEDFPIRHAEILMKTGKGEEAKAVLLQYITEVGKKGVHYQEALTLYAKCDSVSNNSRKDNTRSTQGAGEQAGNSLVPELLNKDPNAIIARVKSHPITHGEVLKLMPESIPPQDQQQLYELIRDDILIGSQLVDLATVEVIFDEQGVHSSLSKDPGQVVARVNGVDINYGHVVEEMNSVEFNNTLLKIHEVDEQGSVSGKIIVVRLRDMNPAPDEVVIYELAKDACIRKRAAEIAYANGAVVELVK